MVFTELSYAFFLITSLLVFYLAPKKYNTYPLIIISIVFYWYFAGSFLFVLLAETVLFYFTLRRIKSMAVFWTVLSAVLGLLAYFKYRLLIASAIDDVFHLKLTALMPSAIVAPLAISFFTFEFVHYWIDTREGKIKVHSFPKFLAFIFFFPTMFAGPIKRYEQFVVQIGDGQPGISSIRSGSLRILIGFFKKIVIADVLSEWVTVLQTKQAASIVSPYILWIGTIAYAFKIYMDFSGYSDIAIGSSKLFGFTVPENFNNPYMKGNISLFWKSWHMSLTSWIWDYLFLPLSASLRNLASTPSKLVAVVAGSSFITMVVVGLWHGADWHFIVWGAYHGILLAVYTVYSRYIKPLLAKYSWYPGKLFHLFSVGTTFFFVLLSWPFFVTNVSTAVFILRKMFFL